MAGLRVRLTGLSVTLLIASSVQAFDAYSYPYSNLAPARPSMPVVNAAFPTMACPCEPITQVRYACPTAAPSSPGPGVLSSNEPPLAKPQSKGPTIYQNRTFSGVPQLTEARTNTCKVSFWNLSGLDVTLNIGERTHSIPRDRAVILDLDRHFTWRTNFHNPKTEDVSDDLNHFEVMIR